MCFYILVTNKHSQNNKGGANEVDGRRGNLGSPTKLIRLNTQ
jgi:hypothetical protein